MELPSDGASQRGLPSAAAGRLRLRSRRRETALISVFAGASQRGLTSAATGGLRLRSRRRQTALMSVFAGASQRGLTSAATGRLRLRSRRRETAQQKNVQTPGPREACLAGTCPLRYWV